MRFNIFKNEDVRYINALSWRLCQSHSPSKSYLIQMIFLISIYRVNKMKFVKQEHVNSFKAPPVKYNL